MTKIISNEFNGFSPKTFDFLINLEFNNNKAWFEENKPIYLEYVVKPFKELIKALSEYMLSIDPEFDTRAEVSKTISRIYRDIRFSKDKSPYRSSVWLTFKRANRDWKLDPCFFFEITPSVCRYGMGFFVATKETIMRLREVIDEGSEDFKRIVDLYTGQKIYTLEGEKYKKILDKSKTAEELEWYQRKSIHFMCERKINEGIFTSKLAEDLKRDFEILRPFYEFLWKVKR